MMVDDLQSRHHGWTSWAMSSYTDDKYPKHSVTLSFRGMEENDEMQRFHDNMMAVEKATVQAGVQNSVQWFKKKDYPKT